MRKKNAFEKGSAILGRRLLVAALEPANNRKLCNDSEINQHVVHVHSITLRSGNEKEVVC